ncbi:MAG TPA: biopolymer transporter ExbD [bacterium]|nr:biopolymer transporter ExbD [bacterium]
MEFEGRKKVDVHFDIAPLVDIVFLLLLFFLLTSQFIKQPGMKIDLPKAQAARNQDKMDIIVSITRDEKYFLNGKPVDVDGVKHELCGMIEANERKVVIIKADRGTLLQPVVTVMDYAKICNASGVTISTKLKSDADAGTDGGGE